MLLFSPSDGMGHGMALAFHVAIFRLPVTGSYTTTIANLAPNLSVGFVRECLCLGGLTFVGPTRPTRENAVTYKTIKPAVGAPKVVHR